MRRNGVWMNGIVELNITFENYPFMDINKKEKKSFADWLELLQQESWQLELLVSGFALFGIWESQGMLFKLNGYLSVNRLEDMGSMFLILGFILLIKAAWSIFFINLLIHVILRGLWIGAIGLRYVSGDINYRDLDYHEKFETYLEKKVGRFDHYIERLEKICSVIFAYTFLLFFIFISSVMVLVHLVLLGVLINFLSDYGLASIGWTLLGVYVLLGFFVLMDFLTIGSIKKIRNNAIATGYSYVYRFYSYATLSFFYRPLLFNFFDYKYTRRLFWFSVPYVIIALFLIPGFYVESNSHFPYKENIDDDYYYNSGDILLKGYYDDLRYQHIGNEENLERKRLGSFSLGSSEITHSHGTIFFNYRMDDRLLWEEYYKIPPLNDNGFQHTIFDHKLPDTLITQMRKEESKAVLAILRAKKAASGGGTEKSAREEETFGDGFKIGRYGKKESIPTNQWDRQVDSLRKHYTNARESLVMNKIKTLKNAMMDANQLFIDGQPFSDQLSCTFAVHPNLGEKGIKCYFPVDSLAVGEHILQLERKKYNPHKLDSIEIVHFSIPFWVLSKR